jgi:hypothetical protein
MEKLFKNVFELKNERKRKLCSIESRTQKKMLKAVIKKCFISIVNGEKVHMWHEFAQKKSSERIFQEMNR